MRFKVGRISVICLVVLSVTLVGCMSSAGQWTFDRSVVNPMKTIGDETIEDLEDEIEVIEIVAEEPEPPVKTVDDQVDEILAAMSLEEKVAQLFYISLTNYYTNDMPSVGGVIFFDDNMTSIQGVHDEIISLQSHSTVPMFIGIDEEGGIVSRITGASGIGGTLMPSPWRLAHMDKSMNVYQGNHIIAEELNALGFNMNFAPVADVRSNMDNEVIGKRAFSDEATEVAGYVREAIMAYDDQDIIPVIKHFPGHGDTEGDSHLESVYVTHDMDRLREVELLPFIAGIEEGCKVIMVGHIQVPNVSGDEIPASLSESLIKELLIDALGYDGLVISDALNMNGITNHYENDEVIDMGLKAGLDMFLMPYDYGLAYDYLLEKSRESTEVQMRIEASVRKVIKLKIETGIYDDTRLINELTSVGSIAHKDIVEELLE